LRSVDILIWFTIKLEDKNKEKEVFSDFLNLSAKVLKEDNIELIENLWGFTKKSVYVKNERSPQEIDPFSEDRKKFFIVYPFIKNAEWYLLKQDSRQGMMNEHIRIGKKYPQILQLLIYSFGLSDQEFVVAYECDSLIEFEELVQELRSSDARKYTLRDTPIYTSIFREPEELIKIYSL
jgi:chlorite dismutase